MADDEPSLRQLTVPEEADGQRLDLFLAQQLSDVSRSRVQLLLEQGSVLIGGKLAKASRKVRSGESISILGDPQPPPLRAMAEAIPLEIVYEDSDLAVVNKPAGMMVHAGSGATEDARNRGTLVNALLHHMRELSSSSGPLRPGIVHRLDKQTSGLIVVAKNDVAHARLSSMFSRRQVRKLYLALVQGELPQDSGTVNASISRDTVRRTRMTTRREGGRNCRLSLAGAAPHSRPLRQLHLGLGSYRDRAHPSDSRPHGFPGASRCWGHALRSVHRDRAPGRMRAGSRAWSCNATSCMRRSWNSHTQSAASALPWFPIFLPISRTSWPSSPHPRAGQRVWKECTSIKDERGWQTVHALE